MVAIEPSIRDGSDRVATARRADNAMRAHDSIENMTAFPRQDSTPVEYKMESEVGRQS